MWLYGSNFRVRGVFWQPNPCHTWTHAVEFPIRLRQFMYTKFIVVVDDDINIRDWKDVIWAITTRVDPTRDTLLADNTPIDYLDFASPVSGLGSKMGLDATNKWPGETSREWGRPLSMSAAVTAKMEPVWQTLGL